MKGLDLVDKIEQIVSKVRERELNYSIVTARNLGLENKDREPSTIRIEKFLIDVLTLHGLNCSDIVNIALESYLIDRGYLTGESLAFLNSVSKLDKDVLEKGLMSVS
ncbi:MAG: hypothetical protein PHW56_11315, partial [Methanosarcinaceae archaeon]|nr:hypothetical protein [Methanosarcinaceae archaeon]